MYKCEQCKNISKLEEKQNKKIITQRKRTYWNVVVLDFITKTKKFFQYREKDLQILDNLKNEKGYKILKEYITSGQEIVKEINVCNNCK